ncbi:hypothetical protein ACIBJF_32250 [Streptomyces sp. NPDC050743]|uniref:hypothetical protein n=1 Tax=Streptomyces sp. NPDC050743 TaxID=3365634 RepID=UPI0037A710BC
MADAEGPADTDAGRPGRLTVCLGAAPGVGKTYRMLDEGQRRAERRTDVVVAYVNCHGRRRTEQMLRGLLVVPRQVRSYRGRLFSEMDLEGLLTLRPETALVDELAHTNIPGGRNAKRWQDVLDLLAAGIDVVTTVNVHHLESLSDVVEKITGMAPPETVPEEIVRRADQVELVDVDPEALRRRLVHGGIYPPELVDSALTHFFRPGNLTALRELAVLWMAGRVDEAQHKYRTENESTEVWESRERVMVALPGGPEGEALIRRAARVEGGDLLAVHVVGGDGLGGGSSPQALAAQRELTESLGGTFHTVVGDDVPSALLAFVRAQHATQLVLGVSSRSQLDRILGGRGIGATTGGRVSSHAPGPDGRCSIAALRLAGSR